MSETAWLTKGKCRTLRLKLGFQPIRRSGRQSSYVGLGEWVPVFPFDRFDSLDRGRSASPIRPVRCQRGLTGNVTILDSAVEGGSDM